MTLILFVIGIVLIILEMMTVSTFLIWPGIGVLVAAFASLFTSNVLVLAIVFAIATLISVGLLKTEYIKLVMPKEKTETSYNEYIGKHAILINDYIANGVDNGVVRLNGVEWSVKSKNLDESFKAGERVTIIAIEGVHLIIGKEE